jgi:peptidoglycan/LPS O-acetylase OafA/YrhL
MVVFDHLTFFTADRGWGRQWFTGMAGVDIFFVISGFVMAHSSRSLAGSATPGRSFLARRVERIYPLYWILTTLKIVLTVVVPKSVGSAFPDMHRIVFSYLLLPTWNADGAMIPVLSWGWTLQFEMLFYLLFTFALALRWKPLALVTPALIVLGGAPLLFQLQERWILGICNPIVLEFLFGMLMYSACQRGLRSPAWVGWLVLSAGFAAILLAPDSWGQAVRPLRWGLPATAIVAGAILLEPAWGRRSPRWMLRLGDGSYSLYLLHFMVCAAVVSAIARLHFNPHLLFALALAVGLAFSLLCGELLFRWVELPLIRFFRGRRKVAVVSGT